MLRVLNIEVYMLKAVSRVLVIAVMLISFIGQAIAFNASMSCETSVNSLSHNPTVLVRHYNSKALDTGNHQDCCGIDCCDIGCSCSANVCSSFVYFTAEVNLIKAPTASHIVDTQLFKQPKNFSALLYRPPIFIA